MAKFSPIRTGDEQLDRVQDAVAKAVNAAASSFSQTVTVSTGSPWIAPTWLNGWTAVSGYTPGYFKDALGVVRLRGIMQGGTLNSQLFALPAGCRPGNGLVVAVEFWTGAAIAMAELSVSPAGVVAGAGMTGTSGYNVKLDGITFLAEPGGPAPSLLSAPIRLQNTLARDPGAVLVAAAQDVTSGSPVPVAVGAPAWTLSQDQIVVSDVAGLAPSRKYQITLLVLGN